jgi:hypothetical protein
MGFELTLSSEVEEKAPATPVEDVDALLDQLDFIDAPCPPMLALALGYRGRRRFVAFYRTPSGTPRYNDGVVDAQVDPRGYAAVVTSKRVLRGFPESLCDRSLDSMRVLVVDTVQLAVFQGPTAIARRVLGAQSDEVVRPAPQMMGADELAMRQELGLTDVDDLIRWYEDPTDVGRFSEGALPDETS